MNTPLNSKDLTRMSVIEIEAEARRLRAEAVANGLRGIGNWVSSKVASLTHPKHQHSH